MKNNFLRFGLNLDLSGYFLCFSEHLEIFDVAIHSKKDCIMFVAFLIKVKCATVILFLVRTETSSENTL